MEVTLLGTGCPVPHRERFGPAQVVRHGGTTILVDCGSGVTQRLLAAGSSGTQVDEILLTHLHSDHIVDLFQLILSSWHQGRDRPQVIYGPPGTRRYIDGLMTLWRPELEQRVAHERRPSTIALEVEVREIEDGEHLALADLRVEVVEVDHKPVRHAFGFIFEGRATDASGHGSRPGPRPGPRIVLSGDTRRSPALIEAARGAEVLVHEVFVHRELPVVPGVRSAETVEQVAGYHTLSSEVGKIAAEAEAGCLVLTHFVPPTCDRQALLDEIAADFPGPVILGEDLMTIDAAKRQVRTADGAVLGLGTAPD